MTATPRRSDPRPRSAECVTAGHSPLDAYEIRTMARDLRRQKGLVLIDPARVLDPWRREAIEQEADKQLGGDSRGKR